jgi:hypothetical protein
MKTDDSLSLNEVVRLIHEVGGNGGARQLINHEVMYVLQAQVYITDHFTLSVDESAPIESFNERPLHFVNDDLVSINFPPASSETPVRKDLGVFTFNRWISSDAVIASMNLKGYLPSNPWDLLTLARNAPDLQMRYAIIALAGTTLRGERRVVRICRSGKKRCADVRYHDGDWEPSTRFLAFKKKVG